jgi:hypothetical protein
MQQLYGVMVKGLEIVTVTKQLPNIKKYRRKTMNSNTNKIKGYTSAEYAECIKYYESIISQCVPEGKTAIAFFSAELWREEEMVIEDPSFWQTHLGEDYEDVYYDKMSYFGVPLTSDNLASLDEMQYMQEQLNQSIEDFDLCNSSIPQFNFRVHKSKFDLKLYEQYPGIHPLEVPRRYLDYFLTGCTKLEAYPEVFERSGVRVTLLDDDQIASLKTNFPDGKSPDGQKLSFFKTSQWSTYYRPQYKDCPYGEITIEIGLYAKIRSHHWVYIDIMLLRLVEYAFKSGMIDNIGHLKKDGFRAIKTYYDTTIKKRGDKAIKTYYDTFTGSLDMKEKFNVVFEGFDTLEQANALVDWYCDGGEQDSALWLEEATDLDCALVNVDLPTRYQGNNVICLLELHYKES